MRRRLRQYAHLARQYMQPKAVVLMYHKVTEPDTDIWDLAVSPAHFEQQLRVLKQLGIVVSTSELSKRLHQRNLKRRSVAITFDDGYLDNYLHARPLLEKYQLPATFFIVSGNVGLDQEFWWDELAAILLLSEHLPPALSLTLPGGTQLEAALQPEQHLTPELWQQHQQWRASEQAPPTLRAALFYNLWQQLRPLPAPAQQLCLRQLRAWAGRQPGTRPAYRSISLDQLRELHSNTLFTIGAHTRTHPALASHPVALQREEVEGGRQVLYQATGQLPEVLAYPYGSYGNETAELASQLGFKAAFTTDARLVTSAANPHKLGRFQVNNWNGDEFKRRLTHWLSQ
jgi:peptidoglycan/xylan/chitin deacetylase (PgdA/CDA1 family)